MYLLFVILVIFNEKSMSVQEHVAEIACMYLQETYTIKVIRNLFYSNQYELDHKCSIFRLHYEKSNCLILILHKLK